MQRLDHSFACWRHIDGHLAEPPSVVAQSDGRLLVFVKSAISGGLEYVKQKGRDESAFSAWGDLGGRPRSF